MTELRVEVIVIVDVPPSPGEILMNPVDLTLTMRFFAIEDYER
jgi:hypothetical protein